MKKFVAVIILRRNNLNNTLSEEKCYIGLVPFVSFSSELIWSSCDSQTVDTRSISSLVGMNRHSNRHTSEEVQVAFKILMTLWILQFAWRIAFRCVLHRCGSQDIRCWKCWFTFFLCRSTLFSSNGGAFPQRLRLKGFDPSDMIAHKWLHVVHGSQKEMDVSPPP